MKATLRLKLHTDPATTAALHTTLRLSTACFNAVCRYGWHHHERNGIRLHHGTYRTLRAQHPTLPSQLVVSARMKAGEALKSGEERHQQGRMVSCPQSTHCPIRYDARSYGVHLQEGSASLATVSGRVHVSFRLPAYCARYADWKPCSADLCLHNGAFFLHVVVEADTPEPACEGVLGVDLGIAEIAGQRRERLLRGHRQSRQEAYQAPARPAAKEGHEERQAALAEDSPPAVALCA